MENLKNLDFFIQNYSQIKQDKSIIILTKPKNKLLKFHTDFSVLYEIFNPEDFNLKNEMKNLRISMLIVLLFENLFIIEINGSIQFI